MPYYRYYVSRWIVDPSPPLIAMQTVEGDSPQNAAIQLVRDGKIPLKSNSNWAHFVSYIDRETRHAKIGNRRCDRVNQNVFRQREDCIVAPRRPGQRSENAKSSVSVRSCRVSLDAAWRVPAGERRRFQIETPPAFARSESWAGRFA